MKILLTGGSGDLAQVLLPQLLSQHHTVTCLDIKKPLDTLGHFVEASIFDRDALASAFAQHNLIIHSAAWHSHHETLGLKNADEFWDLNVTGTYNVFQAAKTNGIKKVIFISSASVDSAHGIYGWTKLLGEDIAQRFVDQEQFEVLTLRPGTFIPHWNSDVYANFVEWAKWFARGGVHINDVAQAVVKSVSLLATKTLTDHLVLPVDSEYKYSERDLKNWDAAGKGTTFVKHYGNHVKTAIQYGLDPTAKPLIQDISMTKDWLEYEPQYSLNNLLSELEKFGEKGPAIA